MNQEDMDDIFDEDEKAREQLSSSVLIKQEIPDRNEETGLCTFPFHSDGKLLKIKSENCHEELNDIEIKVEDLILPNIETQGVNQPGNENQFKVKLRKRKKFVCVICQNRFISANRRNIHLSTHFDIRTKQKNKKSIFTNGIFGNHIFICAFCGQCHLNKKEIFDHCQQHYLKIRRSFENTRKKHKNPFDVEDAFEDKVKLESEDINRSKHLSKYQLYAKKTLNNELFREHLRRYQCKECQKIFVQNLNFTVPYKLTLYRPCKLLG